MVHVIYIVIFLVGYMFFFGTKELYEKNEITITPTEINREIEYQNRNFKIFRWEYSSQEYRCEIELDILNKNYDGNDRYLVQAVDRQKGELPVEQIISEPTRMIIQINEIPEDFAEISLRITPEGSTEAPLKLYATKNSVKKVKELPKRSKEEYQNLRIEHQIVYYQDQIKEYEEEIAKNRTTMSNCDTQISELQEKKAYQTSEEQKEMDILIQQAEGKKMEADTHIQKIKEKISQIEDAISQLQEKLGLRCQK